MKFLALQINLIVILISYGSLLFGQKSQIYATATIGVATPILDNGIGFHIGINPTYRISTHFSLESQISDIYTRINSSFLSGDSGMINSINFLFGGRLYIVSAEQPKRFYLNLMVGGNCSKEKVNDDNLIQEFKAGFSSGGFVELKQFILGLSFDTPQHLILKVGYAF